MEDKKTYFGNDLIPEEEKKPRVKEVFDSVAGQYDLMNDLMSLGTHRLWKNLVMKKTGLRPGQKVIDVAGGTADLAIGMAGQVGDDGEIVVYDINGEMLTRGREKCIDSGLIKNVRYVQGDAEHICFADSTFHCATIGFGIRNVTDIPGALKEMTRVLKPGGRLICLEFSHPTNANFEKLYDLYSFSLLPLIGEVVTKDRDAYVYLAESIRKFPPQDEFKEMMEGAGLFGVKYHNLFGGIAAIHIGYKV